MPKRVFTEEMFALITQMVSQNMKASEIAERLGCKLGSLKVRCSQRKISLRTPNWKDGRKKREPKVLPCAVEQKEEVIKSRPLLTMQSSLMLSRVAASRLRQHAETLGMTEAALATSLLELIAKDDLYDAVLDTAA